VPRSWHLLLPSIPIQLLFLRYIYINMSNFCIFNSYFFEVQK
jgi:hypothetical protein